MYYCSPTKRTANYRSTTWLVTIFEHSQDIAGGPNNSTEISLRKALRACPIRPFLTPKNVNSKGEATANLHEYFGGKAWVLLELAEKQGRFSLQNRIYESWIRNFGPNSETEEGVKASSEELRRFVVVPSIGCMLLDAVVGASSEQFLE